MANSFYLKSQTVQGRYMYITCTQTPDIATNSSKVDWTLTVTGGSSNYYTTGETQVHIGGHYVYYKERVSWSSYKFPAAKGSVSGSVTVTHNEDGTLTLPVTIYTMIYNGVFHTNTANWTLDKIDRYATITEAPNFNDEQNPTIVYSNPAGEIVESLQACISLDGSADDIHYRDIPKDGASYTFALTNAEKETLYKATTGSTSRSVKFIVKTMIGGAAYTSSLEKTFSVINAAPQLSALVMDMNETTVALTGDRMAALVKGYSNAGFEMSASALKGAEITEFRATNGSSIFESSSGTFERVESSSFTFSVKDDRGLNTSKQVTLNLVEYFKPTCKAEVSLELDSDTTIRAAIKISGSFFNGSFGYENNSLEILIKHSAAEDWVSLTKDLFFEPTTNGNSYYIDFGISGLDYTKPFTYQCKVIDKLESATSAEETVSYNPLFDWGAEDFNFNVPVKMNGNTVLRHTDANKVVLSAEKADIYLRPNGTTTDDGQLRLFTDGTATLNGSRILTVDTLYPIGSIYMSLNATNPSVYFGGTWERIQNRFLLAAGADYEAGSTGGEATHTLTVEEMPKHRHQIGAYKSNSSTVGNPLESYSVVVNSSNGTDTTSRYYTSGTQSLGGSAAHNNMPPYLAVYMWKRTA